MTPSSYRWSSRLIFAGFALLALSNVIFVARFMNQRIFGEPSYRWEVQLVLEMLSPIFTAGAWWFLCRWEAQDSEQQSLHAKAYFILGFQFLATGLLELLQVSPPIHSDSFVALIVSGTIGSAVGAVGFFTASHAVAKVDFASTDT